MAVDLKEIRRAREQAECVVDADSIERALDRMGEQITQTLGERNPLVFAVMNGGLILAGRLLPRLPFALEVGYLHASRYGHALQGRRLDWHARPTQCVKQRTVLVLDDILDEGHTLHEIITHLQQAGAAQVYSAVLTHKRHARKAYPGMRADFTGVEVDDRFLFGCGMDYKGYWRNAPGIYAVKGT